MPGMCSSCHVVWFCSSWVRLICCSCIVGLSHMLISYGCADEVDALLGKRKDMEHEVSLSMKTEFMSLWDGIETSTESRVVILGATNRMHELDEAVLRRSVQICCLLMFIGVLHDMLDDLNSWFLSFDLILDLIQPNFLRHIKTLSQHGACFRFTLAMEVKLPDAAAREDILIAHLRKHTQQNSFGKNAVDQELLQVRLLAAIGKIESARPCIKPFALQHVVPTARLLLIAQCCLVLLSQFNGVQRLGTV